MTAETLSMFQHINTIVLVWCPYIGNHIVDASALEEERKCL